MSRVPWPLPPVAPPGTPAILGFPKPPDEQYAAPGMSPHSGLPLPAHTALTPIPSGFCRSSLAVPTPTSANASPWEVPSFVNPAGPLLQDFRSPCAQIDTSFSYGRNYRPAYGLSETSALLTTTVGAPGSEDPAVYPGVPPLIEGNSSRVDGGRLSPKVKERDLTQFISNLRGLVTQAEHSVNQILNLVKLKPDISGNSSAFSSSDNLNNMPAEVISHHSLTRSNPHKILNSAVQKDNSSLRHTSVFHIGNRLHTETDTLSSPKTLEFTSTSTVSKTNAAGDGEDVKEELTRTGIIERAFELWGSPKELLKSGKLLKEMINYLNDQCGLSDKFFYKDAPAVVHVPALPVTDDFVLPGFAIEERWVEFASWMEFETLIPYGAECKLLLPSKYWLLKKELGSWKGLPLHYTSTQLEAAVALSRVKRTDIRKRLLAYLPSFGLVLDRPLLNHILFLVVFCLRAVHREAMMISSRINIPECRDHESLLDESSNGKVSAAGGDMNSLAHTVKDASRNFSTLQGEVRVVAPEVVESRALFDGGGWLASLLFPLYGVDSSQNLVLSLYRQALEDAAYSLAFSDMQSGSETTMDTLHPGKLSREKRELERDASYKSRPSGFVLEDGEQAEPKAGGLARSGCGTGDGAGLFSELKGDRTFADDATVGDGTLSLWQIAAAIAAIQKRAAFEQSRKTEAPFLHLSRFQRSSVHDSILKLAEEERAKRTNYRAVLEHDGLLWQRQQNKNNKKGKTMEEILADERDYKRRRMSYRGKKVQRTPSQVLHDIIEGHMEEIAAAGGIGCFGKRLQELPALQMETECSRGLPLQASYGRNDVFVDEQRSAVHRNYFHSNDRDSVWSKEHSCSQEMSSSEVRDKSSKASHLESSKHSKFRTPDKYEYSNVDEKHRQNSGRSVSTSYSSRNHSPYDHDKHDSHGQKWYNRHRRSHYETFDDNPFSREHDSVGQFDRWESKSEEKDEHRYLGEQHSRHWSRLEGEKDDHRGPQEGRDERRRSHDEHRRSHGSRHWSRLEGEKDDHMGPQEGRDEHRRSHDEHRRSHGKDRDEHRRSHDEQHHSRHGSRAK